MPSDFFFKQRCVVQQALTPDGGRDVHTVIDKKLKKSLGVTGHRAGYAA